MKHVDAVPDELLDDSSVYRRFRRWERLAGFEFIRAVLPEAREELGGCDWKWPAADAVIVKAKLG